MYFFLKERQYYENRYDHQTVERARFDELYYEKFLVELKNKMLKGDTIEMPRYAVVLNAFYMQAIGNELLDRYERRDQYIDEWMVSDESKDDQIATARLAKELHCHHCNRQGLRIIDKSLMHRGDNKNINMPEEVLFMLRCTHCNKNSAFWEDGEAWVAKSTLCPKCSNEMTHKTNNPKQKLTFIYTCSVCQYSYKEKINLNENKKESDPNYKKDRIHYCLIDEVFRHHLFEIRRGLTEMAELGKYFKERDDNKHIYDAIKELKKTNIAGITPLLQPTLEKAGYIEFSLDKPEMGKDVFVGFSCLDSKSDRNDYDSKKMLEKLITKELNGTNWRLMSDGVSYRLGYLSGRLHGYEREEDLKRLVIQNKNLTKNHKNLGSKNKSSTNIIKDRNGNDIIL